MPRPSSSARNPVAASPGASAAPSIRVHQGPGQGHGEHAEDDLGDRDRVLVAAAAATVHPTSGASSGAPRTPATAAARTPAVTARSNRRAERIRSGEGLRSRGRIRFEDGVPTGPSARDALDAARQTARKRTARRCCDAPASRGGHPPVSTRRGATWCCASNSSALRVVAYRHVLRPVVECLEHGGAPPSNQHQRQGTR
jgi:hypothetical protein